jgi:hypothetical protein
MKEEFEDTKGVGYSESVNRKTDNTMAKRKRINNYLQNYYSIYKAQLRKLMIEQHEPH